MRRLGAIVDRLVLPEIIMDSVRVAEVTGEDVGDVFDRLWAARCGPAQGELELEDVAS